MLFRSENNNKHGPCRMSWEAITRQLAGVAIYYRYPLLRLDLTFGLSLMIPSNRTEIPSNLMGFRCKFRLRRLHSTCVCVKFKVRHGDPHQSVTSSIFSTSPLHRFLRGKRHGTCKQIQLECACKNLEKSAQNCGGNRTLGPTEGGGNDSIQTIYPNKAYSGIFCVRIFIFPNRETNSKITDILHPQCYLKAAESLTRGL